MGFLCFSSKITAVAIIGAFVVFALIVGVFYLNPFDEICRTNNYSYYWETNVPAYSAHYFASEDLNFFKIRQLYFGKDDRVHPEFEYIEVFDKNAKISAKFYIYDGNCFKETAQAEEPLLNPFASVKCINNKGGVISNINKSNLNPDFSVAVKCFDRNSAG